MWSVTFRDQHADKDCLIAELWAAGTVGIIEEDAGLRAFFEDDVDPAAVLALVDDGESEVRQETTEVKQSFVREGWDPILVGERFYLVPPWVKGPGPSSRMRLEVDAATAFGTGRHETTQLCIESMERILRPEDLVLDVGCGSGILSAVASMLGARKIFSCDIHEDAIANALQHVNTPIFRGSADAVSSATMDLVLANISATVLDTLAFDLRRVVKPDGHLILSGFVNERVPKFYRPKETYTRGDWLCWICEPADVTASPQAADSRGLVHRAEWWL